MDYIRMRWIYIRPLMSKNRQLIEFCSLKSNDLIQEGFVVLGYFVFVYINPYTDGNGRIGRFLMNVMLAAGGYPWTVIPVEKRDAYMSALEAASVDRSIVPFVKFLGDLVTKALGK